MSGGRILRTRDLASLAGVTPRALRHYHRIGLLAEAPRDPNGYRRYSAADLVRVLRIRELAASGMSLRDVARALDHDAASLADQLAELERGLASQAERIDRQRSLVRNLRRSLAGPGAGVEANPGSGSGSGFGPGSSTAQFDRDVWLVATGTGAIDSVTATQFERAVTERFAADGVPEWLAEFESLEGVEAIDDSQADQLAEAIATFARALSDGHDFGESEGSPHVLGLVEELQASSLSRAQWEVWQRFQARIAL